METEPLPAEMKTLQPWLSAFARTFGAAPRFTPLDAGAGLFAWTFPPVFADPRMIGGTGHFRHRPAMVEHVRRLGFDWQESPDPRLLTCPTPETFNRLLARNGLPDCGYRLEIVREDGWLMSLGPWLRRYMAGWIPLHLGTRRVYRPWPWRRGNVRHHLTTLVHDITVHALNYHLVPRAEIAAMSETIRAALPAQVEGWAAAGASGPLTLAYFLDNDFNRYCYGVWCASERPDDFPRIFSLPRNRGQLEDALKLRLDETRGGFGDVHTGDTRDMTPLAAIEFDIG